MRNLLHFKKAYYIIDEIKHKEKQNVLYHS